MKIWSHSPKHKRQLVVFSVGVKKIGVKGV